MESSIRVLITDDHPMFRIGLATLVDNSPRLALVGQATSGEEAVEMAGELQPDVVLMDLRMPGLSGIDATRQIVGANPDVRILVVTMFEDDHLVFTALRAGARGYILKDSEETEIVRAIRAVAAGEAIFSPFIAQRLIDFFAQPWPTVPAQMFPELTNWEREILNLIAYGRSNTEIAQRLFLSPKTVANHVSNIFAKLHVADRTAAIIRAREAGLGSVDQ
ncbi:MAG: response regulator transcription factor [Chloroflexota bacterium]|nr:response regulator transcription factor [Chloroflexota bacterium]